MIFKESNRVKLEEMFKKANGKCRERILTYSNVERSLNKIENHLGINKKDLIDIVVIVDPNAQDFPNAYKYTPYSIYYRAKRKPSGWDVEPFGKYRTARASRMAEITLTDRAKEAIIEKKSFC
jgi:hypothetical protein